MKTTTNPSGNSLSSKLRTAQRSSLQAIAIAIALLPSLALAAPDINTKTKNASFPLNNDNSARPGNTITYTIGVGNNGAAGTTDAIGVQVADSIDSNSTFVNNSAKVSPNAIAHAYNAAGNTQLTVNAASGLKVGVVDIDGVTPNASLVVTAGTFATSQGGSVTIAADGSFTYTPQTGDQNLTDTFSYTVTDGDGLPSTGMVGINLGARVWYVDSTASVAGKDGSSAHPFTALSDISGATGPDAAGDIIFIVERAGDYDGNLTLLNNQLLYGSGAALTVNTIVINAAGGPNTTMITTAANTPSITLGGGTGNTVTGFTIGNTTGAKITGVSFGTLTISNVTMSGSGQALLLNTGTVNGTIDSLTSTSSTSAVSLTTIAGNLTITTGAISGATGDDFFVSAGTANISYGGTITNSAAHSVTVQNKTGGTVTFSGAITDTAGSTGINLSSNTGATITFRGGLSLTTTTNSAFTATGGGTVNVCATNDCAAGSAVTNAITTTTGAALNVTSTNIGASGLTFRSISGDGGSNIKINLDGTGSGAFTVSGNGGSCTSATPTCTGGIIQNVTGADAIRLNNMSGPVSLTRMLIQDITAANDASAANDTHSNVDAIHGTAINGGLTLNTSVIRRISDNGINGSVDGASIGATVWNGLTITNCFFDNTNRFNVANHADATDEGAVFMRGIKGTVSVTGTTFQNASSGLFLQTDTSGTMDMTVQGNSFLQLYKEVGTLSIGLFGIDVRQEGTLTSTIRIGDTVNETNAALGNTFTNGGDRAGIRIIANTASTGNLKVSVAKNT
ncbi:MAG: hypothetical protein QOI49_910, partial [Verrucomicrobiota bacterium]